MCYYNIYKAFFILSAFMISALACNPTEPGSDEKGDLEDLAYDPKPYKIVKPSYFPEIEVPKDNPMTQAGVQLGRMLFYDPILSADSTMSCSSCHLPQHSFTDALAVSTGIDGIAGHRSSMALMNIAYATNGLFWDGRAKTLEDQALLPVEDPIELHHTWPNVVEDLKKHKTYPKMFREAFGIKDRSEISKELAAKALAQFERILVSSGQSKFDRFVQGETTLFDDRELEGKLMYFDEQQFVLPDAQCFHCHGGVTLTGNQYFSNGLDPVKSFKEFIDKGQGGVLGDSSRYGRFRAPTLRNIALTPPYMHDGRFKTLEEVIDHYASQGKSKFPYQDGLMTQIGTLIPNTQPLQYTKMNASHKRSLVKFLHTLTDTVFVKNPDIQNPFK
jgi:cytochrome c peroxidase